MEHDASIRTLTIAPGSWGHKKFKLRNRYKHLSDADLQYVPGEESALLQRLSQRLGLSMPEVMRIVTEI